MSDPKRFTVSFTEAELDALICTVGKVRVSEVHLCRCQAVHSGLGEMKEAQAQIRIGRGD